MAVPFAQDPADRENAVRGSDRSILLKSDLNRDFCWCCCRADTSQIVLLLEADRYRAEERFPLAETASYKLVSC